MSITHELVSKSEAVVKHIQEAENGLNNLGRACKQVQDGVDGATAASTEMTANIEEIAQQAERSRNMVEAAVKASDESKARSDQLSSAVTEIEKILKLIQKIAEQTNLLALNATIEAARAGDAGRGFAVVANEVKALASQTGNATEEISQQIGHIQTVTRSTVEGIESVRSQITEVEGATDAIAAAADEQSIAAREISQRIQQACDGVREVDTAVDTIATGAKADKERVQGILDLAKSLAGESAEPPAPLF